MAEIERRTGAAYSAAIPRRMRRDGPRGRRFARATPAPPTCSPSGSIAAAWPCAARPPPTAACFTPACSTTCATSACKNHACVTVFMPDGAERLDQSAGYAGFIGTVTAMNERGLAIGEMGGRGEGQWDGMPMSFLLRDVMERAATVDEALAILRDSPADLRILLRPAATRSRDMAGVHCTPQAGDRPAARPAASAAAVRARGRGADLRRATAPRCSASAFKSTTAGSTWRS